MVRQYVPALPRSRSPPYRVAVRHIQSTQARLQHKQQMQGQLCRCLTSAKVRWDVRSREGRRDGDWATYKRPLQTASGRATINMEDLSSHKRGVFEIDCGFGNLL